MVNTSFEPELKKGSTELLILALVEDINPRNAAVTHALVDKIASASPDLVARVRKAIGQDE